MNKQQLAKFMHDQYEEIAKEKGWNTQDNCKVQFSKLPKNNKDTMIEVADRILKKLKGAPNEKRI